MEAFLLSDDRHGPASCQPSLSWGHAIPWRRVWAVCCLLFAVCCALVCCALVCDGVLGAFLVQRERNRPHAPVSLHPPPIRPPYRTRPIFAAMGRSASGPMWRGGSSCFAGQSGAKRTASPTSGGGYIAIKGGSSRRLRVDCSLEQMVHRRKGSNFFHELHGVGQSKHFGQCANATVAYVAGVSNQQGIQFLYLHIVVASVQYI